MPSERLQVRLHPNIVGERDALDVLEHFRRKGMSDREIAREALIALGEKTHQGWQPETLVGEGKVTAESIKMLRQILSIVQELSVSDFVAQGALTKVAGQLTTLQQGATQLLGEAIFYQGDDD